MKHYQKRLIIGDHTFQINFERCHKVEKSTDLKAIVYHKITLQHTKNPSVRRYSLVENDEVEIRYALYKLEKDAAEYVNSLSPQTNEVDTLLESLGFSSY